MSIFKAYDIRGKYPTEINEEIGYKIGRAFVLFLRKTLPRDPTVIVARDMRLSSPALSKAVIQGILDQGGKVVDIGLASTPTFYFGVAQYGYDGGIQISASHNPKEDNGCKIVREHAIALSSDTGIKDIEQMVIANQFPDAEKGTYSQRKGVLEEHVTHDLRYVNTENIQPLTIVADTANAMGGPMLRELFKHLPCNITILNERLDGSFPAHQPDPFQEENLKDLSAAVLEHHADLGIAPDGDCDRIFFVDNHGQPIRQEIVRGLLAQLFLTEYPHAKVCYDIRPGKITEEMILSAGGVPVVTRVGHSFIKEAMRKEGAVFAGESSGHFFLKMISGTYEIPMIVVLKLLELISTSRKSISEIIRPYQKYYHSGEINFRVENKQAKLSAIENKYRDANINRMDGISFEYPDWWCNVRASNTESLLRVNIEGTTREIVELKRKEITALMNESGE